ncbi:cytochrome c oxidase polypeptide vib [Nannochloropsis oceanica]
MSTLEVSDLPVPAKDERFPTINQALNCWNKYNEWVLCLKNNEKDEAKCFLPRFNMRELCPGEWVEKWDADRDGDKFAGLQVDDAEH